MEMKFCNQVVCTLFVLMLVSSGLLFLTNENVVAETSGDFEYQLISGGNEVEITRYNGDGGDVVVPGMIDAKPVTSLGGNVFTLIESIITVSIPSSVKIIDSQAFYNCASLTSINVNAANTNYASDAGILYNHAKTTVIHCPIGKTGTVVIPNSVVTIGDQAFNNCHYLTSVTIGSGVTTIGFMAFYACEQMTSINIPNSVTLIDNMAFQSCTALTSVTIGSGVTSIESNAFYSCTALTSMTIPGGVTSIGSSAFQSCTALTSIVVSSANAKYASMDGALYNKAKTTLITCPGGMTGTFTIPNTVTSIEEEAFRGCDQLTSIKISENARTIGNKAFAYCTALTSITIPYSVKTIGDDAFHSCTALTSVTIGSGVSTIGNSVFDSCELITSITIPNSVKTIGYGAFQSCTALTTVTIGSGLTSNGSYAFSTCTALTSIDVSSANVNYASTDGVLYDKAKTTLTIYPEGKTGTFTIPDTVTSIGESAFYHGLSLTSITIPNSVTSIGSNAFSSCNYLTSVTIGSGVTSIGSYAFTSCTALTSITIPSSVTTIGDGAFSYCDSMTSITFLGQVAATSVVSDWIVSTSSEIIGHAYATSNLPAPGGVFNGLTMGAVIPGDGNNGDVRPSQASDLSPLIWAGAIVAVLLAGSLIMRWKK
jgi:hypothetical protein